MQNELANYGLKHVFLKCGYRNRLRVVLQEPKIRIDACSTNILSVVSKSAMLDNILTR